MSFAWKSAGITFNRYSAICARVLRRSMKEELRTASERRGVMDLKMQKWESGKASDPKSLSEAVKIGGNI